MTLSRLLIVALLALGAADERTPVPGFFDLPVSGGTATFEMLGLRPEERGSAIAVLARSMFSQGGSAAERAAAARRFVTSLSVPGNTPPTDGDSPPITIAVPLTADAWRDVLAPQNKGDLFAALISNRPVLLVCAGAVSTDATVRTLLERDRGLLRWIARNAPAAFWVAARSLKIEKDKVAVPGGAAMEPIWEGMVGVKVTRPAEFLRALLGSDGGRLAYFYDAVSVMAPARQAVVFGPAPTGLQLNQTRALYQTFRSADSNWRLEEHPFLRNLTDPSIVTAQVALADGGVAPPNAVGMWEELFDRRNDFTRRAVMEFRLEDVAPVTLAWLAQQIASVSAKERRDRYEMVRFAQGVFPAAKGDETLDVMIALGGYRRYRALLLTLDRMEITTPRVYSRAVEAARRLDELSGRDRKHAVIAFQAALAIIERARVTRGIDVAGAERLVLALADVADTDKARAHAITQWMVTGMLDGLPPLIKPDQWTATTAYESRLLQVMAGTPPVNPPVVPWEGLTYRVDYFASEHDRIKRIREQLASPGLDAALAANNEAQIAEALLVLIYAPALGDPDGPALLGGDIAQRHDFGMEGAAGLRRDGLAWGVPREQVGDGSPWHIEGSLLGLDIALARLALRRLSDSDMPVAPTINLNDQLTLSRTVRALNPLDFRDADRDRILDAITRGRQRVAGAGTNLEQLLVLGREVGLSAAVRQTLPWLLTRTPELAPALFGLRDFFWLGRAELPDDTLHRWGMYTEQLTARLRPVMPSPAQWENFGGRADGGIVATQMPDLTLRMAEETARLKLPAQLIPGLLTYATQDFWHDVDSRFADDLPAMSRQALALLPQRVEDYVAALAGEGPLRPR